VAPPEKSIRRTTYTADDDGNVTLHRDNYFDFNEYSLPMARAHNASLLLWGVAQGLTVTAAVDQKVVTVAPGTAVDANGNLIKLRPAGAYFGDNPADAGGLMTLVPNEGVTLAIPRGATGTLWVTITYLEKADSGLQVHAPHLQLQPTRPDDSVGNDVVLAAVTVADGKVKKLESGDRRSVGSHADRLELRAVRADNNSVAATTVATLAARPTGGLDVNLTGSSANALSIGADGNVAIDTGGAAAHRSLEVNGSGVHVGGPTGAFSFADRAQAFVEDPDRGQRWEWYAEGGAAHLASKDKLLSVDPSSQGAGLHSRRPIRVSGTPASIGFSRNGTNDVARLGLKDDTHVGLGVGADWAFTINTTNKLIEVGGTAPPQYTPKLYVRSDAGSPGVTAPPTPAGLICDTVNGNAVIAFSENGVGVWAEAPVAAHFQGDVEIEGKLHVSRGIDKGVTAFKIDHPLAPAEKFLCHCAVESDEMKNVYDGETTAGHDGCADVTVPEWFEALNHRFRYQLTPVGVPAPNLHVSEELSNGRMSIAGAPPGARICWQITGVRHDAFALANPLNVEMDKAPADYGRFLHPEVHGAAADLTVTKHESPFKRLIGEQPPLQTTPVT
jgi:hypothetical protein